MKFIYTTVTIIPPAIVKGIRNKLLLKNILEEIKNYL